MKYRKSTLAFALTMACIWPPALLSQATCGQLGPAQEKQELSEYLESYRGCLAGDAATKATTDMQAASPSSPTPGFGSQLRSSIEDYLSLFNFAIDGISTSDDDKSLTIRFNPIRSATIGSLGLSVTATEPEVGDLLLNEIPEADRPAAKSVLESDLDETDDLTFKASFSFERKARKSDRWLLGRSPENYRELVEKPMLKALSQASFSTPEESQAIARCETLALNGLSEKPNPDPYRASIAEVRDALDGEFDACLEIWKSAEERIVGAAKSHEVFAWIPFLIDNQPQLFLTAVVNERAEEVGRNGWNVKLTYEKGFNNFNTFLRRAAGKPEAEWPTAFAETIGKLTTKEVEAENKMSFSFTYAERDPYMFSRTIGEGDDAESLALDLPRATEVCVKFEYHRNATWHEMKINDQKVFPKFHASLEYIDVSDDPKRRDRMVGVLTYEIPMPSGVNLPISLSYANHSEFLGEIDKELSAHFGLSYKLPGS